MRVLVLTPYPYGTTAGPRSSFELWERTLGEAGIHLEYEVFETESLHRVIYEPSRTGAKAVALAGAYARYLPRVARRLREFDAVLVNREATLIGPALLERWIARRGIPIIYQLDDPLYIPYRSPSNGRLSYLKCFGKVRTICRISRVVLANSASHAEFARRVNRNVWEIPSLVDGDAYDGWKPKPAADGVCVGWSGSPSTTYNLGLIRRPLAELGARPEIELRLIGAGQVDLPGVAHTAHPWSPDTEVEDLRRFDVGLVPVLMSPWAPHKFYLKLVQYMALGIPPIATPLGSNPTVIEPERSGLLADGDDAWRRALARLTGDPALREEMGRAAAARAHARYTLQARAEEIVAAFRSVAGR